MKNSTTIPPSVNSNRASRHKMVMRMLLLVVLFFAGTFIAADTMAANQLPHPPGTCTSDAQFNIPLTAMTAGQGLISTIIRDIKSVLTATMNSMHNNLFLSGTVSRTIAVMFSLYIAIYGVLFTFGMVQMTVYDFFSRAVKLGIVGGLAITGMVGVQWWATTRNILIKFFNDGTDSIIVEATRIAVGGVTAPYSSSAPFALLDQVIAEAVSAKMAVTILATFFTGPYGVIFGLLLILSLGSFLRAMFTAVWVYLMSLVVKTLLIALSPIFIAFLLFNRTRHLFDGWLNQLVNASLQPIFLFVFFAFFASLIGESIKGILATPVCWTEWQDSVRGTPMSIHYWRFAVRSSVTGNWEPYGGLWSWTGAQNQPGTQPFPIDILGLLIFLMLAELASRFNHVIIMIASDIAGAATNLATMQGPMSGWLGAGGGRQTGLAGNLIGSRVNPGGVRTSATAGSGGASPGGRLASRINNQGFVGGLESELNDARSRFAAGATSRDKGGGGGVT